MPTEQHDVAYIRFGVRLSDVIATNSHDRQLTCGCLHCILQQSLSIDFLKVLDVRRTGSWRHCSECCLTVPDGRSSPPVISEFRGHLQKYHLVGHLLVQRNLFTLSWRERLRSLLRPTSDALSTSMLQLWYGWFPQRAGINGRNYHCDSDIFLPLVEQIEYIEGAYFLYGGRTSA
jgi:hypothetical protein